MEKPDKAKSKKSKAFESLMNTLKEIDVKQLRPMKEEADKSPYKLGKEDKPKTKVEIEVGAESSEDEDELEQEYTKKFKK